MKVSKLRCHVTVVGDAEGGEFGWQKSISFADIEDMIEEVKEEGVWKFADNLGWESGYYPHPIIDYIEFAISDDNHVYYLCVVE